MKFTTKAGKPWLPSCSKFKTNEKGAKNEKYKQFKHFDWLAEFSAAEKSDLIRLFIPLEAERFWRNICYENNRRYATRGILRLVENRLNRAQDHVQSIPRTVLNFAVKLHCLN